MLIESLIEDCKSKEAKDKINDALVKFPKLSEESEFIYYDAISDY